MTLDEKIQFVRDAVRVNREAQAAIGQWGPCESFLISDSVGVGVGSGPWRVVAGGLGTFKDESLEACLDAAIEKWNEVATELKDSAVAYAERAAKLRDAIYTAAIAPVGAKILDA